MTDPTTPMRPVPMAPMTQVSINDNLPTSSPSPKSTLIGLACILGFIALFVLYWKTIGF
jgi:hypothetical protein